MLREGLTYDIANIGHPMLFTETYVGTKKIIEDYIDEVATCLHYLVATECLTFGVEQKIQFF